MDAKVDDWVVTPRRGKAVEINALWYNALKLMEQLGGRSRTTRRAEDYRRTRRRASYRSFNRALLVRTRRLSLRRGRRRGAGDATNADAKCRPNQILADLAARIRCSTRERWAAVMRTVRDRLLTPVGLRSLAPGDPRLQAEVLRRSSRARRRLPPGHGLGVARSARSSTPG